MVRSLVELNEELVKIEPNRLERLGWLVDRLYAELNETGTGEV